METIVFRAGRGAESDWVWELAPAAQASRPQASSGQPLAQCLGFALMEFRPADKGICSPRGETKLRQSAGYRVPMPTLCTDWNNLPSVLMLGAIMISVSWNCRMLAA